MENQKPATSADPSSPGGPNPLSRRGFLCLSSGCAFAAAAAARQAQGAWGDPIPIAPLTDFTKDGISEAFIRHNFFIVRHEGRLYAVTSICPHEQNYLFRSTDNPDEIACSGHDSVFDSEGKHVSGRARRSLERFGIAVDDKGIVLIDTNKKFGEKQWDDKASYIDLKARE